MRVSVRRVSNGFLISLTIGLIFTCGDGLEQAMSKFTEWSWQGSFTVSNERAVRTLKPSSEQKNALR